jgi:hypothetical protein
VQKPKGSAGRAAMHGVLDVFTLGIWEVAGTPIEGTKGKKEMYPIKIYYEDGEKINRVELGGSIRKQDKIKSVSQVKHNVAQTERLKSFLFLYCQSYESKDLDKFAEFFAPNATENNKPFHELLPEYRRNMEMVESLNYRIELVEYSLQADTGYNT